MQFVVIGMHRSGTSCVTNVLRASGCYFGRDSDSIATSPENPKGFWERRDMRQICDLLLHSAGADWWKVSRFKLEAVPEHAVTEARRRFAAILAELNQHRPWVIKEPRLSFLLPLLLPLLERPVAIHVVRHPVEAAMSLRVRNGFPQAVGLALWEAYVLAAMRATVGTATVVVDYNQLIADPAASVERLRDEIANLGLGQVGPPAEPLVPDIIDPALHRQRRDAATMAADDLRLQLHRSLTEGQARAVPSLSPLSREALEVFEALRESSVRADGELKRVTAERRAIEAERQAIRAERDAIAAEREAIVAERHRMTNEHGTGVTSSPTHADIPGRWARLLGAVLPGHRR